MPVLFLALALGLAPDVPVRRQPAAGRAAEPRAADQAAMAHHFYLYEDGGAIEISATDRKDAAAVSAIRVQLADIAQKLSAGDFEMPVFIRADEVPGADGLKRLRDRIVYASEDTRTGGRVRIRTRHARALLAVHEFLRFQIRDYKTGDPEHVTAEKKGA